MSDRKYNQRGYQDDDRDRRPPTDAATSRSGGQAQRPERPPGAPAGARRISSEGAKNPNMPGFRQVARCARCGTFVDAPDLLAQQVPEMPAGSALVRAVRHFDPAPASSAPRRSRRGSRRRTPPTNARFTLHAPAGSAKPHRRRARSRPNRPARRRPSTTCSNSRHRKHGRRLLQGGVRRRARRYRPYDNRHGASFGSGRAGSHAASRPRSTNLSSLLLFTQTIGGSGERRRSPSRCSTRSRA